MVYNIAVIVEQPLLCNRHGMPSTPPDRTRMNNLKRTANDEYVNT